MTKKREANMIWGVELAGEFLLFRHPIYVHCFTFPVLVVLEDFKGRKGFKGDSMECLRIYLICSINFPEEGKKQ